MASVSVLALPVEVPRASWVVKPVMPEVRLTLPVRVSELLPTVREPRPELPIITFCDAEGTVFWVKFVPVTLALEADEVKVNWVPA